MNIQAIIWALNEEISRLQRSRAILAGTGMSSTGRKRRHMSAEAKARIAASQRARWARAKAAKKKKKK